MSKDISQHFIFEKHAVRGGIIRLESSFQEIAKLKAYPQEVLQLLANVLVANVYFASNLKTAGKITMQIQQSGALKLLASMCNHQLQLRGMVQWDELADARRLIQSIDDAQLVVTMAQEANIEMHQSIVKLNHQSVASALEHYYSQSEQLQTRVWLAMNHTSAAGLFLQKMPEQAMNDEWQTLTTLTETVTEGELLTLDNQTLLHRFYHEYDVRLFEAKPVVFHCGCNIKKMQQAIITLGESEARKTLKQHKVINVTCEYCNKSYDFSDGEVAAIFADHHSQSVH